MSYRMSDAQDKYLKSIQDRPVSLLLRIGDTYTQSGLGTVVTGTIAMGSVCVKDLVEIVTEDGSRFFLEVMGIEKDKKLWEKAIEGDQIGILFKLFHTGMINIGDIILKVDD